MNDAAWYFVLLAACSGILYAVWCAVWVLRHEDGGERLRTPYLAIREGASSYILTQYRTIAAVGIVIFPVLGFTPHFGWLTAIGFAIGALLSSASGILGMIVAVRANVRTAAAACKDLDEAFHVSLRAGSVTGFLVGSLALLAVSGFYLFLWSLQKEGLPDIRPLAGLGFGASLVSIFARLGGGIFTKAADVGADLAGKIEQGIPEDDPRNPAVIADNVGDNVGDCAGMAADVFESYAITLIATMLVAGWGFPGHIFMLYLPLALGGVAIVASLLGIQAARMGNSQRILMALTRGLIASMTLAAIGFYAISAWLIPASSPYSPTALFYSAIVGLVVGFGMVATTDYYTGIRFPPVQRIAAASRSGHATNIITGLAVGMKSTLVPTLVIAAGVIVAYQLAGVYGIALATCGLLAMAPAVISVDAYGPITDNAGGIVEMAGMENEVRNVTDALDAAGNTTKALTKVFAIGSAGLAALVLFVAYKMSFANATIHLDFSLDNPYVMAGLLIGSLLPFLFSGYALDAVGAAASQIVAEVRRQFSEQPGILKGTQRPDYARAISLLTRVSIRAMILPGSLPVLAPLLVALLWTPFAPVGSGALIVGGMLIGAIGTGLLLALSMGTGGAAWDNAKKYIENGHFGGKGSPAHQAAVTGDTVGDPYKDTAGPAINPMRKVLSLMALLLAPYLI